MAREPDHPRNREGSGKRLRDDPWERLKRVVHRAYSVLPGDPRVADWTEADYLREFAFLQAETDGFDEPEPEPTDLTEGSFDEQLQLAAAGDWGALGLDPPLPPTQASPDASAQTAAGLYEPQSIEDFLNP